MINKDRKSTPRFTKSLSLVLFRLGSLMRYRDLKTSKLTKKCVATRTLSEHSVLGLFALNLGILAWSALYDYMDQ